MMGPMMGPMREKMGEGTLQSVLHPAGWDAAVISQFAWVMFGAGTLIFVAVMAVMFQSIFWLAKYPMDGIEAVFHEGARGSVARSVEDPLTTDSMNTHRSIEPS